MVCGGMISLSDLRASGFGQFNRSLNDPSVRYIMQKWRSGVVLTSSLAQHAVEMLKCSAFVICKRYGRYRRSVKELRWVDRTSTICYCDCIIRWQIGCSSRACYLFVWLRTGGIVMWYWWWAHDHSTTRWTCVPESFLSCLPNVFLHEWSGSCKAARWKVAPICTPRCLLIMEWVLMTCESVSASTMTTTLWSSCTMNDPSWPLLFRW